MTMPKPLLLSLIFTLSIFAGAQEKNACPLHEQHMREAARASSHDQYADSAADDKFTAMKARGAQAMGFDQDATTHHFLLRPDGGVIQVTANQSEDERTTNAVRHHLRQIQDQFAKGDFQAPFQTHAEVPDGVAEMKAHASAIEYAYQEVPGGAKVLIRTKDPEALRAVHAFFKYQIQEHRTGDPAEAK